MTEWRDLLNETDSILLRYEIETRELCDKIFELYNKIKDSTRIITERDRICGMVRFDLNILSFDLETASCESPSLREINVLIRIYKYLTRINAKLNTIVELESAIRVGSRKARALRILATIYRELYNDEESARRFIELAEDVSAKVEKAKEELRKILNELDCRVEV